MTTGLLPPFILLSSFFLLSGCSPADINPGFPGSSVVPTTVSSDVGDEELLQNLETDILDQEIDTLFTDLEKDL